MRKSHVQKELWGWTDELIRLAKLLRAVGCISTSDVEMEISHNERWLIAHHTRVGAVVEVSPEVGQSPSVVEQREPVRNG